MNNIRSTLAIVWRIAAPYFRSEDKWAGRSLLAAVIAIELALVGNSVLINQWRNRFYNALQEKDWDGFVREIIVFSVLATILVVLSIYQLYLNQWLQIRWRRWMTTKYLGEWLHDANHYRMQLQGDAADNPDQRITDDVKMFVEQTLEHRRRPAELDRNAGFLCRHPVGTVGGSAAASFRRRVDDPRLSRMGRAHLCHLRNGADAVDRLAAGQPRFPAAALRGRFPLQPGPGAREFRTDSAVARRARRTRAAVGAVRHVVENWYGIMSRTKRLTAFTQSYSQAAVVFPIILVAPAYFAGKIQLGALLQTAEAFGSVQQALSFFVSAYRTLAEWRAVVARLDGFEMAIKSADAR